MPGMYASRDSQQLVLKSRTNCRDLHSRTPCAMRLSLGHHPTSPMLGSRLFHVCFRTPFAGFSWEHLKKNLSPRSASGEPKLHHLPSKLSSSSPQMALPICNFLVSIIFRFDSQLGSFSRVLFLFRHPSVSVLGVSRGLWGGRRSLLYTLT